jgi:hypothetical protein
VLHAWQEDLDRLSEEENQAFAEEFVTESFRNDRQPYNCVVQRIRIRQLGSGAGFKRLTFWVN